MKTYRKPEFLLSMIILLLTAVLSAWTIFNWFSLSFFVGDLFFVHWLGILATVFIAVLIPVYYILKRKSPRNIRMLLKLHVFGYLCSFMLVSIHFAQNTGRLSGSILRLGDGFVLFLVLGVIVATGLMERFGAKLKLVKYTRFVHRYSVAVFYLVMAFHVLQALKII